MDIVYTLTIYVFLVGYITQLVVHAENIYENTVETKKGFIVGFIPLVPFVIWLILFIRSIPKLAKYYKELK